MTDQEGQPPFHPAWLFVGVAVAAVFGVLWGYRYDEQLQDTVRLRVEGERLYLAGTMNERSHGKIVAALDDNPRVTTLVLTRISGTIDADTTMQTGREIMARGLDTHVPVDGRIASGATHLLCSGQNRTAERGARIGVHAWSNAMFPSGDRVASSSILHNDYVEFFAQTGCGEDFYWFSNAAAPAESIHWMTDEELVAQNVITAFVAP